MADDNSQNSCHVFQHEYELERCAYQHKFQDQQPAAQSQYRSLFQRHYDGIM
jgi:hypothetical protein